MSTTQWRSQSNLSSPSGVWPCYLLKVRLHICIYIRVILHAQPQSPHPPDFANHSLNDGDAVCIQAWCHGKLAYYLEILHMACLFCFLKNRCLSLMSWRQTFLKFQVSTCTFALSINCSAVVDRIMDAFEHNAYLMLLTFRNVNYSSRDSR